MIDKRLFQNCELLNIFLNEDATYWFDFKKKKFLHNIDTFYYSVKFKNDFTAGTVDDDVLYLRKYFSDLQKVFLEGFDASACVYLEELGNLNLLPYSFSRFYTICLEKPEEFDIFIAPKVPKGNGDESVTCEAIIQIRSYMLWMYGVHEAFERSYQYIRGLADMFHLEVDFVQENRVDYCWHSNYLSNPEKFFSLENFYKMRVDRFKGAHFNTEKVGTDDYLIDYVALGKRGQKCFVRIYLKSKEVVEMGYKPFFFKVWLFHGLINRYDFYCYEKAFQRGKWAYLDIARLAFYVEHSPDDTYKKKCQELIAKNDNQLNITAEIRQLADLLTPKINLIMNVEFQTMRKASKTFPLVPFKDNSGKGSAARIYDYLDNRYLIGNYLTSGIFRLVEPAGDKKKSRRPDCGFWSSLRLAKMPDVIVPKEKLSFIRKYNRQMSAEIMKRQFLNKSVMLGFYQKGINEDLPIKDVMNAMMVLNDNDLQRAMRYKQKKSRQLSGQELSGLIQSFSHGDYTLVHNESGVIYDYTVNKLEIQGGNTNEL